MLVYDVTNTASFDNLEDWLAVVKNVLAAAPKKPHLALVANKGKSVTFVSLVADLRIVCFGLFNIRKQHKIDFREPQENIRTCRGECPPQLKASC
jgi:hypothetical protein